MNTNFQKLVQKLDQILWDGTKDFQYGGNHWTYNINDILYNKESGQYVTKTTKAMISEEGLIDMIAQYTQIISNGYWKLQDIAVEEKDYRNNKVVGEE